jgi:Flp pilus assembly protein CpaB
MRPVRIITAFVFAAAVAVTGCTAHSTTAHPAAAPTPASPAPPPPTSTPAAPTTTLPLGHIQRLNAVQAIGGTYSAFAVGTGTILATSNGGRTCNGLCSLTRDLLCTTRML